MVNSNSVLRIYFCLMVNILRYVALKVITISKLSLESDVDGTLRRKK